MDDGTEVLHGPDQIRRGDGNLKEETIWKEGRKHGVFRQWHENRFIARQLDYSHGEKHGRDDSWYPDFKRRGLRHWIGDKPDGASIEWWPNGMVKCITGYTADRTKEVVVEFDETGKLITRD